MKQPNEKLAKKLRENLKRRKSAAKVPGVKVPGAKPIKLREGLPR